MWPWSSSKKLFLVVVIAVLAVGVVVAAQSPYAQTVLDPGQPITDPDTGEDDQLDTIPDDIVDNRTTPGPEEPLPYLSETVRVTEEGQRIVTNPADLLVVANKNRSLPADYAPENLVVPDVRFPFEKFHPKKQLREDAALALEALFEQADTEGIELYAISGYRSYETQKRIFQYNVNRTGSVEAANQFSARPGESEHQTGLSMDVSNAEMNFQLETEFGETAEGQWLQENAAAFGFIIRYPKGKEAITGYQYEPWHLRFVGAEAAREVASNNLTLEEYLTKPEYAANTEDDGMREE